VRFSPLGSRLAVLTGEQTIPVWTIASRSSVELVHDGRIVSLDFSPDDERIVTVSEDGSARAWRADTPSHPVVVWHEGPVNGLDFSPDSNQIVTASDDGTARLWWLSGASLRDQLRAATRHCLRPEFRERYLAEPSVEALRKFESCAGAAGTGEDGLRPAAG
jgi:WD40 repeat protein